MITIFQGTKDIVPPSGELVSASWGPVWNGQAGRSEEKAYENAVFLRPGPTVENS
jgi:hypothetical protein